jgi:YegS/Rv2252/BmrU family lipid kinase
MSIRRATIIYNPMSGRPARRAENARAMIGLLKARGIEATAQATEGPDDATRIARQRVASGDDLIISYGGDGTLNEVLQGMIGGDAALAVWPGGTANVVAIDIGMPARLDGIADVIASGKIKRITLGVTSVVSGQLAVGSAGDSGQGTGGRVRLASLPADYRTLPTAQRYFLMMAGIGLDAAIARGVNKRLKRRTGEFAYWVVGARHLFTWKAEPFMVEVDGKQFESVFTLIGNGKGYGGGMCITPKARLEDEGFEVFIMPRLPKNISYLNVLAACMRGKPEKSSAITITGRHVKAVSEHETWVEVDGEVIGTLPRSFDAVPDSLSLVIP